MSSGTPSTTEFARGELAPWLALRPGKLVRVEPWGRLAKVRAVRDHEVELEEEPLGPDELAGALALSSRVVAERAWMTASLQRAPSDLLVAAVSGARACNLRQGPRIPVALPATYYVHGLALGLPTRVLDLGVGGLAVAPLEGLDDPEGTLRAVSFELDGRLVRGVVRLVGRESDRWRLAFAFLAAADEAAIARRVLRAQVADRNALGAAVSFDSSLDATAQRRHPRIVIERRGATLLVVLGDPGAGSLQITGLDAAEAASFDAWWTMVAPWLRVGSWSDVSWLLGALPGRLASALEAALGELVETEAWDDLDEEEVG